MLNLNNINDVFHPAFAIYKVDPLNYTVSSFEFNEDEHYFKVYYDSELVAEEGEVIIPKSKVNEWFKLNMIDVVNSYCYKEDGELLVNWNNLYMDKFDIDCSLIQTITNDYLNGRI